MTERVILITGASGGLAQAIVSQLSSSDQLILLGRDRKKLEKLYGKRQQTVFYTCDITDEKEVAQLIEKIYQRFGHIDILINNAGFGSFKSYDTYTDAEIRDMFAVNTFAVMLFSRLVGERMAKAGHGHIVNVASMSGLIATSKTSIYSASKFAVIGFSNSLRLELADKQVYVTTVNPGPIRTDFFDTADPSGHYLKSVERFVLSPEMVATKIISILGKNKREVNLPLLLNFAYKAYTLFPKTADFLSRKVFNFK
ncbi:SDR family NAD(P)-dependent oxidoreductase [Streptococcus sciuri]|uniref:SDR family oxidoreductase n=1 Tax=Streptococcus sciuri TaxID=2973939 RepID=A0ABT2F4J7_9STRE|nr:SDR family oxidoreductase [Streptococcus sciuri]MCS4487389.1 SDR family oxidoreductase [Streptococcus sciuri]